MILGCLIKRRRRGIISRWRLPKRNRSWRLLRKLSRGNTLHLTWYAIREVTSTRMAAWNCNKSSPTSTNRLLRRMSRSCRLVVWTSTPPKSSQSSKQRHQRCLKLAKIQIKWTYIQSKYMYTATRKSKSAYSSFSIKRCTSKTWMD